ncbi:hypothetical protein QJS10_CPB11g00688 [Acorus calamus]|uniref:RNase H type-1 domain-containing protein n=1 Tax=Acorus calamus TaxID=4465 RepID=A0AAV9DSU9_ACOCL|nr:hypothetical protein QJS10_CPB11g00688 [Acorus calamus]
MAIRGGLQLARENGLHKIYVCSDSQSLITHLQNHRPRPQHLQDCVQDIYQLSDHPDMVTFCKVTREVVVGPDALARHARRSRLSRSAAFLTGSDNAFHEILIFVMMKFPKETLARGQDVRASSRSLDERTDFLELKVSSLLSAVTQVSKNPSFPTLRDLGFIKIGIL